MATSATRQLQLVAEKGATKVSLRGVLVGALMRTFMGKMRANITARVFCLSFVFLIFRHANTPTLLKGVRLFPQPELRLTTSALIND